MIESASALAPLCGVGVRVVLVLAHLHDSFIGLKCSDLLQKDYTTVQEICYD
jgi:hypothetical protein